MAGLIAAPDRGGDRRARARDPCSRGAGDHFCGGADIVARNARGRRPPARRQHPAPAPDPGPPADPAALRRCRPRSSARCAAGPRASGSSSRWRPTSRSRPTTRRSGNRSPSAASPPTAARPGCCRAGSATSAPASCCCSAASSRAPRRPSGARSTARCPRPSSTTAVDELANALAQGPTVALGPDEVAAAPGCRRVARPAARERGVRARAVVAHRRLPRRARRVQGAPSAEVQRPMTVTTPLAIGADAAPADAVAAVRAWIDENVPRAWIDAARDGGVAAIRAVRPRAMYEAVVPDVRRFGARRADVAGRVRRSRSGAGDRASRRAGAAPVQPRAGSTRSGSTSRRPRCSRTAPRSSACASCRRSCATKRCGASCSASPAPAPTSRRSRPGPSATVTGGS